MAIVWGTGEVSMATLTAQEFNCFGSAGSLSGVDGALGSDGGVTEG